MLKDFVIALALAAAFFAGVLVIGLAISVAAAEPPTIQQTNITDAVLFAKEVIEGSVETLLAFLVVVLVFAEIYFHAKGMKSLIGKAFIRKNGYATHEDIDKVREDLQDIKELLIKATSAKQKEEAKK